MSTVSKIADKLRFIADVYEDGLDNRKSGNVPISQDGVSAIREAARTIEELSAKLRNELMEQTTVYYNCGWIPCEHRLPPEPEYDSEDIWSAIAKGKIKKYLVTITAASEPACLHYIGEGNFWNQYDKTIYDVDAWMPLPKVWQGE